MSGFQIAVVHDCPERVELRPSMIRQLAAKTGHASKSLKAVVARR
jgi:hypothetical protein